MTIYFDDKSGSPISQPPITDPVGYVPTFGSGWGIPSNVVFQYRRVGSSIEVRGKFTAGTTSGATSSIGLPPGLTVGVLGAPGMYVGQLGTEVAADPTRSVIATAGNAFVNMSRFYTTADIYTELAPNNISTSAFDVTLFFMCPIAEWAGFSNSFVSLGGLTPVPLSANTFAQSNMMYQADLSAGSYTLTLPGGTSAAAVGVLDALGNASATNFVRITPATGQSLDTLVANDSYLLDYPRGNVIFYRAAGSTVWRMQSQSTTLVQGGQLPGGDGSQISANRVGEDLSAFITYSNCVSNTYSAKVSKTLSDGNYQVSGNLRGILNGATFSSQLQVAFISDDIRGYGTALAGVTGGEITGGLSGEWTIAIPSFLIRVKNGSIYWPEGSISATNIIKLAHYSGVFTGGPVQSSALLTIVRL